MSADHDHDHDHAHGHTHIGKHPTREDDDVALTESEARFLALKSMLIEKGVVTADEIRRRHEINDRGTPHQGARMVARAWLDPAFKSRMLEDGKKAATELGIEVTEAELMVIENTPEVTISSSARSARAIRARCSASRRHGMSARPIARARCASRARYCANSA